jgi:hypothetical protein
MRRGVAPRAAAGAGPSRARSQPQSAPSPASPAPAGRCFAGGRCPDGDLHARTPALRRSLVIGGVPAVIRPVAVSGHATTR